MGALRKILVGVAVVLAFSLYEPIPTDVVDYFPVWRTTTIIKLARAWYRITGRPPYDFDPINTFNNYALPDKNVSVTDEVVGGVPVRFYRPKNVLKPDALVVWIHGGGFAWGSVKGTDKLVLKMSKRLGVAFASIEYRLAPQHQFPAAHDDCLAVVKELLARSGDFGFQPGRLVLMGASAGGNLAATLSQQLRPADPNQEHPVKLQVLIYPVLQAIDMDTPSWHLTYSPFLTHRDVCIFASMLLTGTDSFSSQLAHRQLCPLPEDASERARMLALTDPKHVPAKFVPESYRRPDPVVTRPPPKQFEDRLGLCYDLRLSPLLAKDMSRLPKAYIQACEYDVLRDDSVFYARRLREDGNDVTLDIVEKTYHGIFTNLRSEKGGEMIETACQFIQDNL